MIKMVILDLDMCILNTHTMTGPFFQPVLDILYASDLSSELKEQIQRSMWTTSLEDVIEIFSIPSELANKLREAYRQMEVPDGIKSFGDEDCLANLNVIRILVTSGYKRFQETKIQKLGISTLFDEIIIDELDFREKRKGKKVIFEELLTKHGLKPREVLVVGDNPKSELGAAKALGIVTAQTVRPTIERWEEADYQIESLYELELILARHAM